MINKKNERRKGMKIANMTAIAEKMSRVQAMAAGNCSSCVCSNCNCNCKNNIHAKVANVYSSQRA